MVFELFQTLHLLIRAGQFKTINYSTFICPFESGKGGKGKKTKTCTSQERKELFRWNKNHCS